MRGPDIPLETWYKTNGESYTTFKKPKYVLKPAEEEKACQDKLGKSIGFWYGTWCKKCCGVYPKFFTEGGFKDYGYYVCLVCGKESKHQPMQWQARDCWNQGQYEWKPVGTEYYQLSMKELGLI